MTATQVGAGIVAAVLVLWMLGAYNRLVRLRGDILLAWQAIDEPLRRRRDVLPLLVQALRGPLAAESAALDAVLAAQSAAQDAADAVRAAPVEARAAQAWAHADAHLVSALARLQSLLEQHPELAAQADVAGWRRDLAGVEAGLQFGRQLFNAAVERHNEALLQFPTRLLRRVFAFDVAGRL